MAKAKKFRKINRDRWAEDFVAESILRLNNGGRALMMGPTLIKNSLIKAPGSEGQHFGGSELGGGSL